MATVDSLRTLLATFEAFADQDFDRLEDLYAEDVTWDGPEPGPWDCRNRDEVFDMFRARMRTSTEVDFDRIFGTGSKVLPASRSADDTDEGFVSLFTVEHSRIVRAQNFHSTEAAFEELKQSPG
jgi:ketosteroid isomerase-like protein